MEDKHYFSFFEKKKWKTNNLIFNPLTFFSSLRPASTLPTLRPPPNPPILSPHPRIHPTPPHPPPLTLGTPPATIE